jgi:class 3 adenylate cyclase
MQLGSERMQACWGFRLHGAAWAFEENNANITFSFGDRQLGGALGFDLIGPDVDLGFRLVALAPPGELLVPLEMAALLPQHQLSVELIGEASLKGIPLDPYPLLRLQER